MKKNRLLAVLICLILSTCFSACANSSNSVPTTKYNLSLNKTSISLEVGQTFQLRAKYGEEIITFDTDDANIAAVSEDGMVTAINTGVAYINVQGGGQSLLCKVSVTNPDYAIVFDAKEQIVVKEGGTSFMLQALAYKDGAIFDSKIEYSVDKEGLEYIETKNKISFFLANDEGIYTITAKIKEGAESTVSVKVMNGNASILSKPVLNSINSRVSWDNVEGVSFYLVKVGNEDWQKTSETFIELASTTANKVYVQAICSGTDYYNSDVAEISL